MPLPCVEAFQRITVQCARLSEGQAALSAKLDAVGKAVLGDGAPKDSLLDRVAGLEASAETARRCGDRFWKVLAVLAAVAAAVIVAVFK